MSIEPGQGVLAEPKRNASLLSCGRLGQNLPHSLASVGDTSHWSSPRDTAGVESLFGPEATRFDVRQSLIACRDHDGMWGGCVIRIFRADRGCLLRHARSGDPLLDARCTA